MWLFREQLWSQMSHLMASFLHEQMIQVYLSASSAKNFSHKCHIWMFFFYFMLKDRHMRPKQVNCHSVHHGWTIFVFNNQHCILIRSINHFGGRWNVVALWPLLYTNCPTALPWLSAAGCVRAHPAQCGAQGKRGYIISEVVFWRLLHLHFFLVFVYKNVKIPPNLAALQKEFDFHISRCLT